uniref:Uncharacterized protein LOC111103782 isoform X2 n=1 Tax=Crassostrea virginica TaxID=6565 RepID=A0A8B8AP40_CRAVI|nr:uncharacterized protein LOC111103782 isoform X2 [Crassostrea virginica]
MMNNEEEKLTLENDENEILVDMKRRKSEEEFEEERQRRVGLFKKRIQEGERTLNIALIGPSGCGKFSFCNSVMTAFCIEGWRERAMVGHYGGRGRQVTHHLLSFPKTKYLDSEDLMEYNYPTLIDMNGFNDSSDDLVEELLRIVFFGRLSKEEKLVDAVNIYRTSGLNELKEHYSNKCEDLKIDRIIFIASATSPPPQRLMDAVTKTAREEIRVIPIFGILTHKDKIDPDNKEYQKLEEDFKEGLGLQDNRFLLCTSYCDDYDKHHGKSRLDQRHPELDIPILRFMQQVCDPAYEIIKDSAKYGQDEHSPAPEITTTVTSTDQPPSAGCEKSKRWSLPEDKMWGIVIREETENEGKHQIPGFQDGCPKPMMDSSPSNINSTDTSLSSAQLAIGRGAPGMRREKIFKKGQMMEKLNEENKVSICMKRRTNEEEFETEVGNAHKLFLERVTTKGYALNIALIGASGCGKSSFCNSVMAAFSAEGWRERAMTGHYGGRGRQVTQHLLSFPKTKYLDSEDLKEYNYPTLVDMNGFNDSSDDLVEELLRIVFFGRLPREEKLVIAANIYRTSGLDRLKEHYSKNFEDLKIDRIIFIASATSPPPQRLMDAVTKTATGEMRVIPIFGVLTHKDKIDPDGDEYQTLEKDFKEGLGLQDNRFLLCTSYCDDYDKLHGKSRLDQRHPELDIPILRFMKQVCDPAYEIIKDSLPYGQDEQNPAPEITTTVTSTDPPPSAGCEKSNRWSPPEDKMWWGIGILCVVIAILAIGVYNGIKPLFDKIEQSGNATRN